MQRTIFLWIILGVSLVETPALGQSVLRVPDLNSESGTSVAVPIQLQGGHGCRGCSSRSPIMSRF
jgi:hypothetical protein